MSTAEEIISHFEGEPADLVVCDGAPDGKKFALIISVENPVSSSIQFQFTKMVTNLTLPTIDLFQFSHVF